MAVCRVEKNKNYTVMSNHHLKNKDISLKAKGLLSLMLSLPEDWDYTVEGLAYICQEGVGAIRTAIIELEKAGYVVREQDRTSGQFGKMIYVIYEEPVNNNVVPREGGLDGNPEANNSDMDEAIIECEAEDHIENGSFSVDQNTDDIKEKDNETEGDVPPICNFPMTVKSQEKTDFPPICKNPISANPISANPISKNRRQLNTNIINTNKQNKEKYVSSVSKDQSDDGIVDTNREQSVKKQEAGKQFNSGSGKSIQDQSQDQVQQIPTKSECEEYKRAAGLGYVNLEKFYDYYSSSGWKENGKQIDWHFKMTSWNLREYEYIRNKYRKSETGKSSKSFNNYQEREMSKNDMAYLELKLLSEGQFRDSNTCKMVT